MKTSISSYQKMNREHKQVSLTTIPPPSTCFHLFNFCRNRKIEEELWEDVWFINRAGIIQFIPVWWSWLFVPSVKGTEFEEVCETVFNVKEVGESSWLDMGKRSRKNNYSVDQYYRELMGHSDPKTKSASKPKQVQSYDFQFPKELETTTERSKEEIPDETPTNVNGKRNPHCQIDSTFNCNLH